MYLDELSGHQASFAPLVDIPDAGDALRKIENTRAARSRGLPSFLSLPRSRGGSLSILSGGPSLAAQIAEIKAPTMVCGSAHDFAVGQGITPDYCVLLDPSPESAFLLTPRVNVKYLVASSCDPVLFDKLSHFETYIWHSAGDVPFSELEGESAVGGGSTVTLRALGIAVLLGFTDLHFYGFDSCYRNGAEHAYRHNPNRPTPFEIKFNGKPFLVNAPLLLQAQEFVKLKRDHGDLFRATVYGDGLVAEMGRAA